MKPLLTVCVTTYNQALYIQQTMDSILAQDTDYDIEILVHDDCSIDGTTEILKEYETSYPNKVKVFYEKENQWGKNKYKGGYNRGLLVPNARGKYIAICEGDDYWIDAHKLQKQVGYLESHEDVSFCCHAAAVLDGTSGELLGSMNMGDYEHDLGTCLLYTSDAADE